MSTIGCSRMKDSMFVQKDFKSTISRKIEKRELKKDYFGFIAKEDIKKGELILEEEAFSYCKNSGLVPLTDWALSLKKNFSKEFLDKLWPRSISEGIDYFVNCCCFDKNREELCAYFLFQAMETKESTIMIPMLISKIQSNMFTWDFHFENLLFFNASFINSCDPKKDNVRYAITSNGHKRKITMKAHKDIKIGDEIAFFYGLQGIKFLEQQNVLEYKRKG